MQLLVKRKNAINYALITVVVFPVTFLFSLHFSNLYVGGDQIFYHRFFDSLYGARISDIPYIQFANTGSGEPLYGLLSWIGSKLLPKNEWISIFNALLIIILFLSLEKANVSRILYPLFFSNYYIFVIMFSAERLKFGILFVLIAFIASFRWRVVAAGLSVLFHFQTILFLTGFLGIYFSRITKLAIKGKANAYNLLAIATAFFALALVFRFFGNTIIAKVSNYSGDGFVELTKFMALFIVGLSVTKDKLTAVLTYLPLALATFILGGDRINMVTFIFTLYYTLSWNRGLNPVTIILLGYFSTRGISFLLNIVAYGSGYPNDLL